MWPVRISNQGLLALESDVLPTALRGPAQKEKASQTTFLKTKWLSISQFDWLFLSVH